MLGMVLVLLMCELVRSPSPLPQHMQEAGICGGSGCSQHALLTSLGLASGPGRNSLQRHGGGPWCRPRQSI